MQIFDNENQNFYKKAINPSIHCTDGNITVVEVDMDCI